MNKLACAGWMVLIAVLVSPTSSSDWPHTRGPGYDGKVEGGGVFASDEIGLDLAWRITLGSGYSGIAIAGGRVVTAFAEGDGDWVGAFDAETSDELWRYRIGDLNRGHDGADDGPLSSPVIADDTVFALGARGQLLALRLEDGKLVWSKGLEKDFKSEAPEFGFTTTPLVEGNVLVLQSGGADGRSIVGLDAKSGRQLWAQGSDRVAYQSPTLMTLAGRRQVVAVSRETISGIDPRDGKLLWEHALGENDRANSASPTALGEDRFLIDVSGSATVYRVKRSGKGDYETEELYRSQALGRTYAPPVYHDGHVYGFRGQVLTCMKADDGERVWRSRPPGGDGLILVDDQLVIFGSMGNVVVADATPAGYNERARTKALDGSSLTWPSFAGGRIFVRNLDEMAAVSVTKKKSAAVAEAEATHEFARWVKSVEATEDSRARATMVDAFFTRHSETPVAEGSWVHFVYRGDAADVALAGTMIDNEGAVPLERVSGTDLFYKSYRLEPKTRWEYRFQLDFDEWVVDSRNPRVVPALEGEGEMSELVLPGYGEVTHLAKPDGPRGTVESFTLESEILGYDKELKVWLPPGYANGKERFPLLLVNDGGSWLDKGLLTTTLDNVVGKQVRPVIVVFVPPHRAWWEEAGGTRTEDYVRMQAEELVPALAERYRVVSERGAHGQMGNRFYAISAAYAAFRYPELFGRVGVQSVFLGLGIEDSVQELIAGSDGSVVVYLDWNRFDERNVDRGYDVAEHSRELASWLEQSGHEMSGGEMLDSCGWSGWRNRSDKMLAVLFPVN